MDTIIHRLRHFVHYAHNELVSSQCVRQFSKSPGFLLQSSRNMKRNCTRLNFTHAVNILKKKIKTKSPLRTLNNCVKTTLKSQRRTLSVAFEKNKILWRRHTLVPTGFDFHPDTKMYCRVPERKQKKK